MGDGVGDLAFWLAMGGFALGLTLGPIGNALGRWIESKSRPHGLPPESDDRLAQLEGLERRIAETEERLDFAERLLAQQRTRELEDVDTPPEELPTVR